MSEELPLIERDNEIGILSRLLEETGKGKGMVLDIVGDAGIGKTRLVREFVRQVGAPQVRFIETRCNRDVGALPYGPWIQILKELPGTLPSAQKAKAETFIPPEFLRTEANISGRDQSGSAATKVISILFPSVEQEKLSLFDTIGRAIARAAEESVLILFLDDLMWADDATIELLTYVSQGIQDHPILIITAFRDSEVEAESPLGNYVYQAKRDKLLKEIRLRTLSRQGVAAIIESLLSKDRSTPELVESIFSKTGGNPFFVEEITRSIVEQLGSVESTASGSISELRIPTTVRTVIKQRLGKLTSGTFQTLATAAIIGRDFPFELLRDVTETSEDALLDQLEEALRARILSERKIGQIEVFQFVDAPIHEYLVQEISLIRRRKYHKKIAELMEQKHPDLLRAQPERLAFHYLHVGDNEKALKYTLQAAENAERFYAHEDARKLYQQALELIEEDPELEAEILERIAFLSFFVGDPGFKVHFERAISACKKRNLPRRVAALYIVYSMSVWTLEGSPDKATQLCLQALAELGDDIKNSEAAGLHAQIARIHTIAGRLPDAIEWAEKAVKVAEVATAPEVLAQAYQTLAISLPYTEKQRIIKLLQDAMEISKNNNLFDPLCRSHVNLGYTLAVLENDFEGAASVYRAGVEEAKRRGYPGYRVHLSNELAYYCFIPTGKYDLAQKIAEENLKLAENWKVYKVYPRLVLGHICMVQGNYQQARAYFEEALPLAREVGWTTFISGTMRELGALALETNDLVIADRWLRETNDYLLKIGAIDAVNRVEIMFQLGRVALLSNNLREAKEKLEQIEELSNSIKEKWVFGFQAELSGYIAQKEGRLDEAQKELNEALRTWEATQREPDAARVRKALQSVK